MMEKAKINDPIGVLFWIVGVVALIWNGLRCMNFVQQMSLSGLSTLPPEYQTYIEARPPWAFVSFAVSIVAGLCCLKFLRRSHRMATASKTASVAYLGNCCCGRTACETALGPQHSPSVVEAPCLVPRNFGDRGQRARNPGCRSAGRPEIVSG